MSRNALAHHRLSRHRPQTRARTPLEPLESRVLLDVTFSIDTTTSLQPISPYIYGTNYGQASAFTGYTFARVGGNRWTAYNWTNNASNAGADWYYSNDGYLGGGTAPGGAVASIIVDVGNHAAPLLLTIPANGYVSADKSGNVDITDPNRFTTRFVQEYARKGSPFTLTPPGTGPVYQDEFVNWVKQTYPAAQSNPSRPIWYSIDNEPDLWSSTHPEVHPAQVTYQELIDKTVEYAGAIKDVSSISLVFGPVNYGWNGMRTLQDAPDKGIAGGLTFQQYYLQQIRNAEIAAGRKLVDVNDIHYYSEARDALDRRVVFDNYTDATAVTARVQAARSLYDPAYVEKSWITQYTTGGGGIDLLHRVQNDIATYNPGTKIGITEYGFGGGGHISGGIAQAEALGAFGRLGVFAANYWQTESSTSYIVSAFNMFRNFDGGGGKFGDTSALASTSSMDQSGIFASVDASDPSRVVLLAINRTGAALSSHFNLTSLGPLVSGQWYALTGSGSAIQNMGSVSFAGNYNFDLNLPAYSVNTIALTIQTNAVATPTFSPAPGTYGSAQNVTITTTTPGATIRYTLDGSTPTSTHGLIYDAPVPITSTTTLKAMAYAAGKPDSAARSGTYTIITIPVAQVYQDALAADWADWSWDSTINLANTSTVQAGTRSIAVTSTGGWSALSIRKGTALNTSGYASVKFWVHGGTGANKSLQFFSRTGDETGGSPTYAFTAVANTWTEITVPLSALGNPSTIKRIDFQNATANPQSVIYFDDIRLEPPDTTAPAVSSYLVSDGATQRSMLKKLTVVFTEDVTVPLGAADVRRTNGSSITGLVVTPANPSGDKRTWEFTFSGTPVVGDSLPDGIFNLIVYGASVHDLAGNAMTSNYTRRFHRLFGDSDGDRDVDNTDLAAFRLALNKPLAYVAYFDYDGNGSITNSDYAQFKQRIVKRVLA